MRHLPGLFLLLAAAGCGVEDDPRPAEFDYISTAILQPSCGNAACHSSQNQRKGLILDNPDDGYRTLVEDSGYVNQLLPEESGLVPFILRGDGELRMPLDAPLPDADIDLIDRWILAGAPR